MSKKVADVLWEMLAKAGVKRCYGIVGDALNPVVDALRRNGAIEFVSVRHEEYGVFAAVAEAYFTGNPVVARQIAHTESFHKLLQHYVEKGPAIKPIRPEFLAATLSEIASDDAMFFADTGTACIWLARHIYGGKNRRLFGSFSWASMANAAPNAFGCALAYPGRQCIALCGDGGFTMLGMGDLLTQIERRTPVVQVILNNEKYDFVHIEQQEAGFIPSGVEFKNPNFAKVAEAMGAKGIRIEDPQDVREGLAEALAYKVGPVVVDAVVDPFALAMPSHSPFHTVKGFTLSFAKQVLSGRVDTVIKEIGRNVGIV